MNALLVVFHIGSTLALYKILTLLKTSYLKESGPGANVGSTRSVEISPGMSVSLFWVLRLGVDVLLLVHVQVSERERER